MLEYEAIVPTSQVHQPSFIARNFGWSSGQDQSLKLDSNKYDYIQFNGCNWKSKLKVVVLEK